LAKTDPVVPLYDFRDRNLDSRLQLHAALGRVPGGNSCSLPAAETACGQVLTLPIRPSLTDARQSDTEAVNRSFAS
jgi:dTDP-4-amino-4,6-dideoxygalactose transaminase